MRHPRSFDGVLKRFRQGTGSDQETREIVQHLLGGCTDCQRAVSPLLGLSGEETAVPSDRARAEADDKYAAVFARVDSVVRHHQLRLAEEEAAVPSLLQELARHPRARQAVLARNSSRFHSWRLAEALLDRAYRLCQREPEEAEHAARLGIEVAEVLSGIDYGSERLQDLRARAQAELGNVLRVRERYRESEHAFARATHFLRSGTGDPVEKAALLSLEASLWRDRHEFEHAISLLDRSIAIARRMRERKIQGVALVQKAHCDIERGRPEDALPVLLEAQGLLSDAEDPRLLYVVQHNILYALVEARRYEEAAAGLEDTWKMCCLVNYPVDRIRFQYLAGRVDQGLGNWQQAEEHFRSALHGMLAEGLDYDAALVGLDLAALLNQQNRHAEVRELAAAMLPVFTSHRIHREAIAALLVFQEAVQREKLSSQLVEELSTFLRNAASDPQLRFQPPAWLSSSRS